ncbi:hypothetical protein Syun_022252 [Stephania yunnanensis]|uniref:Uncharacterized protein n=1 Tax=Stephania yunnanensis TaxID=152371 RepID=A0AAP0IHW9_9MAGN
MDDLDDLLKGTSLDDSFYAQQFSDLDFEELFPGKASGGADASTNRDMDMMECQFDEGAPHWHPPS